MPTAKTIDMVRGAYVVEKQVVSSAFPSPLNGEKVAEGRMRGGHADDFGSHTQTFQHQSASSPLTPTLSPLRGEGDVIASRFHGVPDCRT